MNKKIKVDMIDISQAKLIKTIKVDVIYNN